MSETDDAIAEDEAAVAQLATDEQSVKDHVASLQAEIADLTAQIGASGSGVLTTEQLDRLRAASAQLTALHIALQGDATA